MRRVGAAFFLGDTAFLSDPKFRKLSRRLPDPDDFNSAVGAYWIALAAARRNGKPQLDLATETGSRFLGDLCAVGLLDSDGFPLQPFEEWAPRSPQTVAGQARAAQGERDAKGKFLPSSEPSTLDTLDKLVQPSTPIPSTQLTTEGGPGETDDLWALYGALTRTIARKPAVLDWLERLETTYGIADAARVLRDEHAKDGNPGTILGRVNARLEHEAKRSEIVYEGEKRAKRIQSQVEARRLEEFHFTGKWREEWGPQPEARA